MAEKIQTAWGIDIGQAGLKAIKLRYAEAAKQAVAVAFDYVPHPKILSQPDAIPEELIPAALETFLSRNTVKGDKLVIAVPGQTSLAKFIKLPPVESSKVAEIVKYEARQQIPFDLDDVIWDYQPLGGGVEESGFMLEAEVGLFAMKREQVLAQMQPFIDASQEVEIVQTAPLALYNFLSYDVFGHRTDHGDPAENGSHSILIDMGADNTTLLVSNGRSIWIRNVPIGGNHFTRALTKEMKLTFAKAEHLKCNATRSPDPRAVFQALRPVFNDYVSEIQRSIGYFSSVNREASISKVLGVGNGFKLAGLQKFLQQNLQYEVERVENYNGLVGDSVLNSSLFQDNVMSFAVPYGLALQGIDVTRIKTSLLPPEIAMERTIRRKKPWAIAGAAGLLAAFSLSAVGNAMVLNSVSKEKFEKGHAAVKTLSGKVSDNTRNYEEEVTSHGKIKEDGLGLTGLLERREFWAEVYKAINEAQPRDLNEEQNDETDPTVKNRLKLTSITAEKISDLKGWWKELPTETTTAGAKVSDNIGNFMLQRDQETEPTGSGYVFTLMGYHYRDDRDSDKSDLTNSDREFINRQFVQNLQKWEIERDGKVIPVRKLGITHALLYEAVDNEVPFDPNSAGSSTRNGGSPFSGGNGRAASFGGGGGGGGGTGAGSIGDEDESSSAGGFGQSDSGAGSSIGRLDGSKINIDRVETRTVTEWQFVVKFVWVPTPMADRKDEEPPATSKAKK